MAEHLKVYTPRDVHEILGLSMAKVYDIFRQKTFPSVQIGKRYFVTQEAFIAWLDTYKYNIYYV